MLKKGFLSLAFLGLSGAMTSVMALENLVLDGNLNEWTSATSLGVDGDDVTVANSKADILQAWASHDAGNLQIAYRNDGPIDDTWWPWQVFIDTDRDSNTGFAGDNGVGADYMLQANHLYQYTGSGNNWSWQIIQANVGQKQGTDAEFSLALADLGGVTEMNVLFRASNWPFTGSFDNAGFDTFPNSGAGFFSINTADTNTERSNAITPQIDGDLSDWASTTSFGLDGDDISVAGAQADMLEAWVGNDAQYLYIAYTNDGPINVDTWWPWQTFFDTDNDANTGYQVDGIGADYILQGNSLSRYTGSGTDWSLTYVTSAAFANGGAQAELRLPRSAMGDPASFKLQFKTRNNPFTGSADPEGVDNLPNSGTYAYRMASGESETVSNTLTPTLDGLLDDWSSATSFGVDGDDISVAGAQADWLEAWMAHDNGSLYLAYRNDGPINFGTWWPWQIYFDTDNDPQTGFSVGDIGADFVLEGRSLASYTGSGSDWSWNSVALAEYSSGDNDQQLEMKLPLSAFGAISDIKVSLFTRNVAFTNSFDPSGVDTYTNAAGSSVLAYQVDVNNQPPPSPATYRLTFNATWNANDSTLPFPSDPHFSGLIGATHKASASLWSRGQLASTGIKQVAENGIKGPLSNEIDALINQGSACSEISGGDVGFSPGSVSVTFTVQPECSLVSVVSMLAPSPDWFVGSNALNLVSNGQWRDTVVHDLRTYDAGTDSGTTFDSDDLITSPAEAIQLLPEIPGVIGTFTFTKL
ncbi:MAG: spondin domain-containing protein [Leucothrix sp.]